MTNYYVSLLGNDSNSGDELNPFLTIPYAISQASNGDTINIADGTYEYISSITINKQITLLGRQNTIDNRPIINITTGANASAILCNESNIIIKGLEIVHLGSFSSNDTCINILPGGTSIMNDDGIIVNENIEIDDCRIVYSKFGVSSKAKSFSVLNSNLHSRALTTARAIGIYSQDGIVNINDNTFTSDGNVAIEGIHNNFATNDGYQNKRNGTLNIKNNTCTERNITRRFIFFEVGANNGLENDILDMNIENNTVTSTRDILLFQPNTNDFLKTIGRVNVKNNTISTLAGGYVKIDTRFSGAPLSTSWADIYTDNFTIFYMLNNTNTANNSITIGNINDVIGYEPTTLSIVGGTLPANINLISTVIQESYTQTETGNLTNYDTPIVVNVETDLEGVGVFQIIIVDIEYTNNEGIAYGLNTGYAGVISKISIIALDNLSQPITDFSSNPITLTLELPNANINNTLKLYKLQTGTEILMDPQPSGFPITLTYQSGITWTAQLLSLSDFIIIDDTPPAGEAGGDPHIVNIKNETILIPNEWKYVKLYEKDDIEVNVKCDFIDNTTELHHINNENKIVKINPKIHKWVKNYTFMKELEIYKKNNLVLKYDLINDKLLFGNEKMLNKNNERGLYSITHKKYYPPKNISSYCIYLNNNNFLKLTIDNYWDDINNISLLFYDTDIRDYKGEFFNHNISNNITSMVILEKKEIILQSSNPKYVRSGKQIKRMTLINRKNKH
jgi:hypothetical protein